METVRLNFLEPNIDIMLRYHNADNFNKYIQPIAVDYDIVYKKLIKDSTYTNTSKIPYTFLIEERYDHLSWDRYYLAKKKMYSILVSEIFFNEFFSNLSNFQDIKNKCKIKTKIYQIKVYLPNMVFIVCNSHNRLAEKQLLRLQVGIVDNNFDNIYRMILPNSYDDGNVCHTNILSIKNHYENIKTQKLKPIDEICAYYINCYFESIFNTDLLPTRFFKNFDFSMRTFYQKCLFHDKNFIKKLDHLYSNFSNRLSSELAFKSFKRIHPLPFPQNHYFTADNILRSDENCQEAVLYNLIVLPNGIVLTKGDKFYFKDEKYIIINFLNISEIKYVSKYNIRSSSAIECLHIKTNTIKTIKIIDILETPINFDYKIVKIDSKKFIDVEFDYGSSYNPIEYFYLKSDQYLNINDICYLYSNELNYYFMNVKKTVSNKNLSEEEYTLLDSTILTYLNDNDISFPIVVYDKSHNVSHITTQLDLNKLANFHMDYPVYNNKKSFKIYNNIEELKKDLNGIGVKTNFTSKNYSFLIKNMFYSLIDLQIMKHIYYLHQDALFVFDAGDIVYTKDASPIGKFDPFSESTVSTHYPTPKIWHNIAKSYCDNGYLNIVTEQFITINKDTLFIDYFSRNGFQSLETRENLYGKKCYLKKLISSTKDETIIAELYYPEENAIHEFKISINRSITLLLSLFASKENIVEDSSYNGAYIFLKDENFTAKNGLPKGVYQIRYHIENNNIPKNSYQFLLHNNVNIICQDGDFELVEKKRLVKKMFYPWRNPKFNDFEVSLTRLLGVYYATASSFESSF